MFRDRSEKLRLKEGQPDDRPPILAILADKCNDALEMAKEQLERAWDDIADGTTAEEMLAQVQAEQRQTRIMVEEVRAELQEVANSVRDLNNRLG